MKKKQVILFGHVRVASVATIMCVILHSTLHVAANACLTFLFYVDPNDDHVNLSQYYASDFFVALTCYSNIFFFFRNGINLCKTIYTVKYFSIVYESESYLCVYIYMYV